MTVGGMSAKYFKTRSQSLGAMNAYIEEMVNGQRMNEKQTEIMKDAITTVEGKG